MHSTPIKIRMATLEDLASVQSCTRAAYSKYTTAMNREPAPMSADFASQIGLGQVFVALNNNAFAGYVVFYPVHDHLHLENIAVTPVQSGKGIGKQLMQFVEQTARNRGLSAVELYTNEAMTENLQMYPRLGYIETGRKQQEGFHRVFFRKFL